MNQTLLVSFLMALLLLAPFVLQGRFRTGVFQFKRWWISAAAGISVAYIFIDLLPRINRVQSILSATGAGTTPFGGEYWVYGSALIGFIFFFSLDNLAGVGRARRNETETLGGPLSYGLHLGGFTLYCIAVGYPLYRQAAQETRLALLYGLTLVLHLRIIDHSLHERRDRRYETSGRLLLAGGILAGWGMGALDVYEAWLFPALLGFVGGGVLINSIKEELPAKGEARLLPFVLAALGYGVLLAVIG